MENEETEDFDWEDVDKKHLLYGLGVVAFIAFLVGLSVGEAFGEDPVEQGLNEVCHKFGVEEVRGVSFAGTSEKGNLTIRCSIGQYDSAIEDLEVSIPISDAKQSIVNPVDSSADNGGGNR